MRKNFGRKTIVTPLPVLMIGTYDENGSPNVMNVAWGGQCGANYVEINLIKHKTTDNIKIKKAFTMSFATKDTMAISDYFGIESGYDADKIEKSGVHVSKSEYVDAPIIEEYPLTLECEVVEIFEEFGKARVIGKVINMSADESILDENGNLDIDSMGAITFDSETLTYRELGKVIGKAYSVGEVFK
ncbi:MAG: flavin reductase [Anaerovoracaceae bacterium]